MSINKPLFIILPNSLLDKFTEYLPVVTFVPVFIIQIVLDRYDEYWD